MPEHVCRKRSVPLHTIWNNCISMSFRPPVYDKHDRPLALCVKGNLVHVYAEARHLESIAKLQQQAPEIRNLAVTAIEGTLERTHTTPTRLRVAGRQMVGPCATAGVHCALRRTRRGQSPQTSAPTHKQHRCPHVRLGGPTQIVARSVALGQESAEHAAIHALP